MKKRLISMVLAVSIMPAPAFASGGGGSNLKL